MTVLNAQQHRNCNRFVVFLLMLSTCVVMMRVCSLDDFCHLFYWILVIYFTIFVQAIEEFLQKLQFEKCTLLLGMEICV